MREETACRKRASLPSKKERIIAGSTSARPAIARNVVPEYPLAAKSSSAA